jgi:hypothetical protein
LRRSKAGEELAEHVAALVAALGELETVLLAFLGVIVNQHHNAIQLPVLELSQVFAQTMFCALFSKVTEP